MARRYSTSVCIKKINKRSSTSVNMIGIQFIQEMCCMGQEEIIITRSPIFSMRHIL